MNLDVNNERLFKNLLNNDKEILLEINEKKPINFIDIKSDFYITIQIENYNFSNKLFITQLDRFKMDESIFVFQLSNASNEQLNILFEKTFTSNGITLNFFAEYWFLNEIPYAAILKIKEDKFVYNNLKLLSSPELNYQVHDPNRNKAFNFFQIENENQESEPLKSYDSPSFYQNEGLEGISPSTNKTSNVGKADSELNLSAFSTSFFSRRDLDRLLKLKNKKIKTFSGNINTKKKKFRLKIDKVSEWSNYLELEETEKITQEVILKGNEREKYLQNAEYIMNLSSFRLPGRFGRTKLVLISPKFILINKTGVNLEVRQRNKDSFILNSNSSFSLISISNLKDPNIAVKIRKNNYLWSAK